RLHVVKRHEDLSRRYDFRHAKLYAAYTGTPRHDIDPVVRLERQLAGIARVHLQPGSRRHGFQDRDAACFRARMPVLYRAAWVQDEWVRRVGLLRERLAFDAVEFGFAVVRVEMAVGVEAFAGGQAISLSYMRPLDSTLLFDLFPGHSGIVAGAARRDSSPLLECVPRTRPAWE